MRIFETLGVVGLVGLLILAYLLLANSKGANQILVSGASASNTLIRTLQGR